ncbi:MAG: hypothetical protein IT432_05640 [Phycisphaerales bacterium]|nr:hypothetical protein [Phycisphaerales bacterium]
MSLLIGATAFLLEAHHRILCWLVKAAPSYFGAEGDADRAHTLRAYRVVHERLSHRRYPLIWGVVYGILIGSAPFLLNAWPDVVHLRWFLAGFLFLVNFATGVAFYSLCVLLWSAHSLVEAVKVNFARPLNPANRYLMRITSRSTLTAALYVSTCITSMAFAPLPTKHLVTGYSVFCAVVLIIAFAAPSAIIANRTAEDKARLLDALDGQILRVLSDVGQEISRTSHSIELIEKMMEIRERISKSPTWPYKIGSAVGAMGIAAVSLAPIVIQKLVDRFL